MTIVVRNSRIAFGWCTFGGIDIDKTPPVITYAGNAGTYTVDQTVSISCSASDSLSGVVSSTCQPISGPAYSFNLGSNSFSASATDRAGNVGIASTSFTVMVTYDSLCNLTRRFVPIPSLADPMCERLTKAKKAAGQGNAAMKASSLSAYELLVAGMTGRTLSAERAEILTRLARAL